MILITLVGLPRRGALQMSKIVLVGANHAGTAAANIILDNYPCSELSIIDRNSNISYLGCGTALWLGRQISDYHDLFYSSKEALEKKGAKVRMETTVDRIDFALKEVHFTTKDGKKLFEPYDKLILATGSLPIAPKIPGAELSGVQFVKLFQEAQKADVELCDDDVKNVAVVGAGYIGVELAEAIQRRGKKALLFDVMETSLSTYYDLDFTKIMDENMAANEIELHLAEKVQAIRGDKRVTSIVTDKGEYPVDMVFMAVGFKPNNILGRDHLELFGNGAYLVDRCQQTSDPNVYAIGDCVTIFNNATQSTGYIALATNAVRSGVVAGHNVGGTMLESIGVQGSNGISVFGLNMVSTGLNLAAAKLAGYETLHTDFEDLQKPPFILHGNYKVKLRIVYDKKTRRILGAQMTSTGDMSMAIHMFSLAIYKQTTIDELKLLDIFFLPHFNQPYNYITMAALTAE